MPKSSTNPAGDSSSTDTVSPKFIIDAERLHRIGEFLGRGEGDIADCLMPDLVHLMQLLGHVLLLEDLAPGFLDEMFALWIPHFSNQERRKILGDLAQKRADAEGFGNEWRAAIEAGRSPNQKGYLAAMVALHMKLSGDNQAEAIRKMAAQTGRDEDSIRRTVTRSKKQGK